MSENEQNQVAASTGSDQPIKLDYARDETILSLKKKVKHVVILGWVSIVLSVCAIGENIDNFTDDFSGASVLKLYSMYPVLKYVGHAYLGLNFISIAVMAYCGYLLYKRRESARKLIGHMCIVSAVMFLVHPLAIIIYAAFDIPGFDYIRFVKSYTRTLIDAFTGMNTCLIIFGLYLLYSKVFVSAFKYRSETAKPES